MLPKQLLGLHFPLIVSPISRGVFNLSLVTTCSFKSCYEKGYFLDLDTFELSTRTKIIHLSETKFHRGSEDYFY